MYAVTTSDHHTQRPSWQPVPHFSCEVPKLSKAQYFIQTHTFQIFLQNAFTALSFSRYFYWEYKGLKYVFFPLNLKILELPYSISYVARKFRKSA